METPAHDHGTLRWCGDLCSREVCSFFPLKTANPFAETGW